jgi:hypothetical protein
VNEISEPTIVELAHRDSLEKAPFTISFHDEWSSWHESPVLKALVNQTVLVTTKEGYIFDGEVVAVENEVIKLTNSTVGNAWTDMTLTLMSITDIYYC